MITSGVRTAEHVECLDIPEIQRPLDFLPRFVAFGRKLGEQSSIRQDVAKSFYEIEQARLLTLKAADKIDKVGGHGAIPEAGEHERIGGLALWCVEFGHGRECLC